MHLRSIALRDWKAYVQARFDFPVPTRNKNIILIGAENGYGKTSLFEAVVLGLFGRDGLPLIARAPFGGAGEDRLAVSYKDFMEGVLHVRALEEGRSSCSVQLTFDDDDGEPIGKFNRMVVRASDAPAIRMPKMRVYGDRCCFRKTNRAPAVEDRLDLQYRDYIASKFLPSTLAAFFMFDGERVSEFADKDKRHGILLTELRDCLVFRYFESWQMICVRTHKQNVLPVRAMKISARLKPIATRQKRTSMRKS